MISNDSGAKPRYRSRKPVKTQGTDHLMPVDLYLGFSLVSLICTLVFHLKVILGWHGLEKPRFRSFSKTKVQIKKSEEEQRYRSCLGKGKWTPWTLGQFAGHPAGNRN